MSNRTVAVTLTANVAGYLVNTERAERATLGLSKATIAAKKSLDEHMAGMTKLGAVMATGGALAAAGLALAIKASAEYGAKMAQLQSLSHANADEMKALSDAAMTVGQAYGFSATQVADAEIELTKAGIGVKAQLGGALKGALTLAAAGQLDVAQATEITTVAMTQFGLSAAKVPHLADLLSAGADKALGSVGDLGEALKNGGLQAHNMGMTIDQTVGLLSAFANAGIIGAEAGTQMRSMFIQLQKPSTQAKKVLDEYGISLSDASGKFVGITKLGDELRAKLGDLTQTQRNAALATIFGSHAITGATVLYQDSGKAAEKAGTSIGDWIKNVNDSGFAAHQAAGKMNSLQGDTQKLAAAFQTDLIKAGQSVDGELRGVVQGVTGLVEAFGRLPQPMKALIMNGAGVAAALGLVGGGALIGIPKLVEFGAALDALSMSKIPAVARSASLMSRGVGLGLSGLARTAAFMTGPFGLALAGTATAIALLSAKEFPNAAVSADDLRASLDQTTGAMTSLTRASVAQGLQSDGTFALARKLGVSLKDVTSAALGDRDATLRVASAMKHHEDALKGDLAAQTQYGVASQKLVQHIGLQQAATRGAAAKQRELLQATDEAGKQQQQFQARVNAAASAVSRYGKGLDANTAAGMANRDALAAMQKAGEQWIAVAKRQGESSSRISDIQRNVREEMFKTAESMTSSRTAALKLAASYLKIPVEVLTSLLAEDRASAKAKSARVAAKAFAQGDYKAALKADQSDATKKTAAAMAKAQAFAVHKYEAQLKANKSNADANTLDAARRATAFGNMVKTATIRANNSQANNAIADSRARLQALNGMSATVYVNTAAANIGYNIGQRKAGGGEIYGRGPKGVDSEVILAAPGEHMWTAQEVDAVGGQAAMYRIRAAAIAGALPRFDLGGTVGEPRWQRAPSPAPNTWMPATAPTVTVQMPDTITVQDASGFVQTMKVVATGEIAKYDRSTKRRLPR